MAVAYMDPVNIVQAPTLPIYYMVTYPQVVQLVDLIFPFLQQVLPGH